MIEIMVITESQEMSQACHLSVPAMRLKAAGPDDSDQTFS